MTWTAPIRLPAGHRSTPAEVVLDERAGHHDMGGNDSHVDDGSGLRLGLKE